MRRTVAKIDEMKAKDQKRVLSGTSTDFHSLVSDIRREQDDAKALKLLSGKYEHIPRHDITHQLETIRKNITEST